MPGVDKAGINECKLHEIHGSTWKAHLAGWIRKHWYRLPEEDVEFPLLGVLEAKETSLRGISSIPPALATAFFTTVWPRMNPLPSHRGAPEARAARTGTAAGREEQHVPPWLTGQQARRNKLE